VQINGEAQRLTGVVASALHLTLGERHARSTRERPDQ
jgi:hypothetical protein